jgi:hypothetical protein
MRLLGGGVCEFHLGVLADETRALARTIEATHDAMVAERPTTNERGKA